MSVSRLTSLVLSAFTMCLVAFPYARPITCDMAPEEQQVVVHAHEAQHSSGAALSSQDNAGACNDMVDCCMANVAPTLARADGVALSPLMLAVLPSVVGRIAAKSTAPLTPPPKA
jgi:hypothetical protein